MRPEFRYVGMVVPTVPAQIPMLEDGDLPGEEDWSVVETLRADADIDTGDDMDDDRFIARLLSHEGLD